MWIAFQYGSLFVKVIYEVYQGLMNLYVVNEQDGMVGFVQGTMYF